MVELVAHPRLLDRPEVQTFLGLHKSVAREVAHRRYCYRDADFGGAVINAVTAVLGVAVAISIVPSSESSITGSSTANRVALSARAALAGLRGDFTGHERFLR